MKPCISTSLECAQLDGQVHGQVVCVRDWKWGKYYYVFINSGTLCCIRAFCDVPLWGDIKIPHRRMTKTSCVTLLTCL